MVQNLSKKVNETNELSRISNRVILRWRQSDLIVSHDDDIMLSEILGSLNWTFDVLFNADV